MVQRFDKFKVDLPLIADTLRLEPGSLEFHDLTTVIEEWLLTNPQ